MSFSYDPYRHIEIVFDPEIGPSPTMVIHCHGCGGDAGRIHSNDPINLAFALMAKHVERRHKRTRDDFKEWSAY